MNWRIVVSIVYAAIALVFASGVTGATWSRWLVTALWGTGAVIFLLAARIARG